MKTIKVYKVKLLVVLGLMVFFLSSAEIMGMKVSEADKRQAMAKILAKKRELALEKQVKNLGLDEYFVYEARSGRGVNIPLKALQESDLLTVDLDAAMTKQSKIISISKFSFEQIKLVCDFLKYTYEEKERYLQELTLKDLVSTNNLYHEFGLLKGIINMCLMQINEKVKKGKEKVDILENLNGHLKQLLMVDAVIDRLRMFILTNSNKFNALIESFSGNLLAFTPDGNFIIAVGYGNPSIYDVKNAEINNFKGEIKRIQDTVNKRDFGYAKAMDVSFDGTKFIWADWGKEFLLCNIDDYKKSNFSKAITSFGRIRIDTSAVVFNKDGTHVISNSDNKLILWNISNLDAITQQEIGSQKDVQALAFNPTNNNQFVAGGKDDLMLWNKIDSDYQSTSLFDTQPVKSDDRSVEAVAFNPAGNKIISYGKQGLILWDIKNKIISHQLMKYQGFIEWLKFSSDGDKIFLCFLLKTNVSYNVPQIIVLRNIKNLENINEIDSEIFEIKNYAKHGAIVLDSHGDKLVFLTYSTSKTFLLHGVNYAFAVCVVTDDQKKLLNEIKNYDFDKLSLLYEISLRGQSISSERLKEINKLPEGMRKILQDIGLLKKSGWFW